MDQTDAFLERVALAQEAALQRYGIRVYEEVTEEPITLAEARTHLNISALLSGPASADDDWLEMMIPAAREFCEQFLGISLAPRTLEMAADAFPSVALDSSVGPVFVLPYGPVQSVVAISYEDEDGVTMDAIDSNGPIYQLDQYTKPATVFLRDGETWPTSSGLHNSVRVRYTTGFARATDSTGAPVLPKMAKAAMLMLLGHFYNNREAVAGERFLAEVPLSTIHLLELVPGRERLGFA